MYEPSQWSYVKREQRAQKKARARRDRERRRNLRRQSCFWVWPFGHIWGNDPTDAFRLKCKVCGHTTRVGPPL